MTGARSCIGGVRALALSSIALFAVSCSGIATAGAAGLDRGYGNRGVVEVELPSVAPEPGWEESVDGIAVAQDGSAFVSVRARVCGSGACSGFIAVFRYGSGGSLDPGLGGERGYFRTTTAAGPRLDEVKVDSRGRVLLLRRESERRVSLMRLTRGGYLDRRFGDGGVVEVDCDCLGSSLSGVSFVPASGGGGTFVLARLWRSPDQKSSVRGVGTIFRTVRLGPDGSRVSGYGREGAADFRLRGIEWEGSAAALRGGGIYLAGSSPWRADFKPGVRLARVSAKGRLDTRFTARSEVSLGELSNRFSAAGRFGVGAVLVRPKGKIDLLGGVYGTGKGYVLRLKPNGHWLRRFAKRGLRDLPETVDEAVSGYEGATVTLGGGTFGDKMMLRIFPGGRIDPAFEWEGMPVTERLSGYGFSLDALAGPRVAVTTLGVQECRTGPCQRNPALSRYLEPPRKR